MKYLVTKSFQHRGMNRSGSIIDLNDAEAADPFIAAHVEELAKNHTATAPKVTNGAEKAAPTTPQQDLAADPTTLKVADLKAALGRLHVHYTTKMTREELIDLYNQAKAAIAGSPMEPNRPTVSGK